MTPVWKETLLPGRMYDPKTGRPFTISERMVRQAHRNFRKMLERGVPVPQVFEHVSLEAGDPDEWRANYAKHCFGHVGDARLSTHEDVAAGLATFPGTLLLRHDVADPADVERLKKCKFVSPKIRPAGWMDSKGGTYEGAVLTHTALTPSPVQFWQRPFQLSADEAVYLSCVLDAPPEETPVCPGYAQAFTDWLDAIELSATDAPDEEPPVAEETKEPEAKGDEGGDFAALVKALRARGINIPDRVKDMAHLITAVEANTGSATPEPEPEDVATDEPNGNPDDDTEAAGGAPLVMSTADKDPVKQKQAKEWAKADRAELTRRINAALAGQGGKGRDPRTARHLLFKTNSIEMSYTDGLPTGNGWEKLVAAVDAYEKTAPTIPLTAAGAVDLSATEPAPAPPATAGNAGALEAAAELRALAERRNGPPK